MKGFVKIAGGYYRRADIVAIEPLISAKQIGGPPVNGEVWENSVLVYRPNRLKELSISALEVARIIEEYDREQERACKDECVHHWEQIPGPGPQVFKCCYCGVKYLEGPPLLRNEASDHEEERDF